MKAGKITPEEGREFLSNYRSDSMDTLILKRTDANIAQCHAIF